MQSGHNSNESPTGATPAATSAVAVTTTVVSTAQTVVTPLNEKFSVVAAPASTSTTPQYLFCSYNSDGKSISAAQCVNLKVLIQAYKSYGTFNNLLLESRPNDNAPYYLVRNYHPNSHPQKRTLANGTYTFAVTYYPGYSHAQAVFAVGESAHVYLAMHPLVRDFFAAEAKKFDIPNLMKLDSAARDKQLQSGVDAIFAKMKGDEKLKQYPVQAIMAGSAVFQEGNLLSVSDDSGGFHLDSKQMQAVILRKKIDKNLVVDLHKASIEQGLKESGLLDIKQHPNKMKWSTMSVHSPARIVRELDRGIQQVATSSSLDISPLSSTSSSAGGTSEQPQKQSSSSRRVVMMRKADDLLLTSACASAASAAAAVSGSLTSASDSAKLFKQVDQLVKAATVSFPLNLPTPPVATPPIIS